MCGINSFFIQDKKYEYKVSFDTYLYLLYNQVGGYMYHLVIAKDKECKKYLPIKSGDYNFISKYTIRFMDSKEIREKNKKIVNDFEEVFQDYGDIVIINDENNNRRIKVLYKKDYIVAKNLMLSQKYIQHLVDKNIINNLSEYDYRIIMFRDNKSYKKSIKEVLKKRIDYYLVLLSIVKKYDEYRKMYPKLPSKKEIYDAYIEDNKKNNSTKLSVNDDINYDTDNEYFDKVYSLYQYGLLDEVLNTYSLDDLYSNLKDDELDAIGLNGYHR